LPPAARIEIVVVHCCGKGAQERKPRLGRCEEAKFLPDHKRAARHIGPHRPVVHPGAIGLEHQVVEGGPEDGGVVEVDLPRRAGDRNALRLLEQLASEG
jgi:hypothetical protein